MIKSGLQISEIVCYPQNGLDEPPEAWVCPGTSPFPRPSKRTRLRQSSPSFIASLFCVRCPLSFCLYSSFAAPNSSLIPP
ncbi:hypothetical protein L2E82_01715 [Cichorium intybus]|uniref:Uncharacterized protein n=1 Tax=Cichorium intybus TaxID=13427 RepID=A0ACB9GZP1_CICIN|nr:hypothetical protein L2E82_01715 [Cichorium intybus]